MIGKTDKNYDNLPSSLDKKLRRVLLYARISVLAMLDYYGHDGVSYQDIKDAVKLEDGSLGPNLVWMKDHGYIKSKEEKANGKTAVVYYITESGRQAYQEIKRWLNGVFMHNEDGGKR